MFCASATFPPETRRLSLEEALASARETRALRVGNGVLAQTPGVFRSQFPGARAVMVADTNTLRVAGRDVQNFLVAAGFAGPRPFVFEDSNFHAESRFVERLEAFLKEHDAIPIAVGSGTINDLVKLAAHRCGRSYGCVATAASMDGYTAFGASITHHGSKQTFDCPAPRAVVADLDVIAAAPPEMNAWGYADLLAKVTAGADWIVADALEVEPIDSLAWQMVQGRLREAVGEPAEVRAGGARAVKNLVEGLMLGGFAMQATKSSRPASGAEHQFSHLWDMQHHIHNGRAPSHGLKVGIGTLAVTALYERLMNRPFDQIDTAQCCASWPDEDGWMRRAKQLFPEAELRLVAEREIAAKHTTAQELAKQL
ncbi:MAG TPA: iron-containing alcohol dehydrogenase, partial [Verrucomicrobiaceae bacterium]